jgi:organic hydroperoxide reductase OsmC/OhrA
MNSVDEEARGAATQPATQTTRANGQQVPASVTATHRPGGRDVERPSVGAAAEQTLVRTARVSWLTNPPRGHGDISVGSRAFMALSFSEPTAQEPRVTDPSELFAAAHASAVAVTLARILDRNQTRARELIVTATCEYAGDGCGVKAIEFSVHGRIPNIDASQFEEAAYTAIERYRRSFGVDSRSTVSVQIALL